MVGGVRLFGDEAGTVASNVAVLFRQARLEAVKREVPVAVVWDSSTGNLSVRADVSACSDSGQHVRTLNLRARRISAFEISLPGEGLIWLPNNLARNCDNTPFTGTSGVSRVRVLGRASSFDVTISPAGFVEVRQ